MSGIITNVERFPAEALTKLKLGGQIGLKESEELRGFFGREISQERPWVYVDMTEVTFISSSGMSALLLAVSEARDSEGEIIFIALPEKIIKIFKFLDVLDYVRYTVSDADAVKMRESLTETGIGKKRDPQIEADPIRDMLYDGIRMCDENRYEDALDIFESVLSKQSDNVQALKWKIFTLEALGRFSEAREMSYQLRKANNTN
ncbi:MAG: STAS domain-containing protein [bacterium]|nr:STAS domain-containing protein [bacterium]